MEEDYAEDEKDAEKEPGVQHLDIGSVRKVVGDLTEERVHYQHRREGHDGANLKVNAEHEKVET